LVPGLIAIVLLAAACTAPPASQPPAVTPSAMASAAVPTMSPTSEPTATQLPSPSGEVIEGFGYDDILQVDVDGLAVRAVPYTSMPLAIGYRLNGRRIGPVRLDAGYYVSVDLGPLVIGDTTWYRVWPAENAELHFSTILWDTKNDGPNPVEPGWIAASVGDEEYVSLFRASEPQDYLPLLVSGIGDYESELIANFDLFLLQWAYAIDDQDAPCDFEVTVATEGGEDSLVVVDESLIGAFEEGVTPIGAGDGNPIVGDRQDPLVLQVRSDCEWTLRLDAQAHD
jgi:hypothetical protein